MKVLFALLVSHSLTNEPVVPAAIVFGPPVQQGHWLMTPEIIICPHAPVSKERVEKAVAFWKDLGYTIGNVVEAPDNDYACARNIVLHGDILINLPGQGFRMEKHLATTQTWFNSETGEIYKARIEAMKGWGEAERLMEHELGHAFGWRDYNQTGHLMNSNWSSGGYNIKGLKK